MIQEDKRRHMRLKHHAKIRVITPYLSQIFEVDMKDFSESGLFLTGKGEAVPSVGDIVQVQTTEFDDAPIQTAKVIRVDERGGFGLEFII